MQINANANINLNFNYVNTFYKVTLKSTLPFPPATPVQPSRPSSSLPLWHGLYTYILHWFAALMINLTTQHFLRILFEPCLFVCAILHSIHGTCHVWLRKEYIVMLFLLNFEGMKYFGGFAIE